MISAYQKVRRLIRKEFAEVPFHNLFLLNDYKSVGTAFGGTCSDKALHLKKQLNKLGIPNRLISGSIDRQECHRLIQLSLEGRKYFVDIGNGYPSLLPFPADLEIEYSCFGIHFRSLLRHDRLEVIKNMQYDRPMVIIPFTQPSESDLFAEIEERYSPGKIYPFSKSIRFARTIGEKFYFLKGRTLKIYSDNAPLRTENDLTNGEIKLLLQDRLHLHLPSDFPQPYDIFLP